MIQKQKTPRKITASYLHNSGLYYLERYSSSVKNFKRIMKRKIDRSCEFHEESPHHYYPLLEELTEKFITLGLLNDDLYSQTKITSLRRKGESQRKITQKMAEKGIETEKTNTILKQLIEENYEENNELSSAIRYVKRRRLGAFRTRKNERSDEKDLASLARAGYSYDIAKKALAASFSQDKYQTGE